MNNISDKLVMIIILITILFVFGLIFSVKSPERKVLDSPILWKDDFSNISLFKSNKLNFEVNFPFVVNGWKHDELIATIKAGTPYVQVIPFKRDSWKMSIKEYKKDDIEKTRTNFNLKFRHFYRDMVWSKKNYK